MNTAFFRIVADRAPLLPVAIALMCGIVIGDRLPLSEPVLSLPLGTDVVSEPVLPMFLITVVVSVLTWRFRRLQSLALLLSTVALGVLLTTMQRQQLRVVWPSERCTYEAVITSQPQEKAKTIAVDLLLPANKQRIKAYISKDSRSRRLAVGDGLLFYSAIQQPAGAPAARTTAPKAPYAKPAVKTAAEETAPAARAFDYRRYLFTHGFTGTVFIGADQWQEQRVSLRRLSMVERSRLFFLRQRSRLLQHYRRQGADEAQYAVLAAMTLGDKSALSRELREVYSTTGASHVLALSGLHLGIIYSLLSLLVVGRRWRVVSQLLIILAVWAFVFLVGLSPSVVRAAVMLTVYALLSLGGRRRMSVSTLAFTAICLLVANPYCLYDIGFQLSFAAVFAILLFLPLADRVVAPHRLQQHTLLKWLWAMLTVSLAAQIGVAPLLAYYFGSFSCYFLLTNLLVIPCAYVVLWLALCTLLLPLLLGGLLPQAATWLLSQTTDLLFGVVSMMNSTLTWLSRLPGASVSGLHPTALQVVLLYVVIGAVLALLALKLKSRTFHSPAHLGGGGRAGHGDGLRTKTGLSGGDTL